MTVHNDPRDPAPVTLRDQKARDAARLATIIAAVAAVIAVVALIFAFTHGHDEYRDHDSAPGNCDPATDYVCEPEIVEETATVDVPTTSMSPTEVPVPSTTRSEIVTTTVRP